MKKQIRILHVVGSIGIGGIQNYLMNLYRNIDKNVIQFDFLVHIKSNNSYEDEIKKMGGRVFYIEDDYFEKKKIFKYIKFIKNFYKEHPEYEIVHGHLRTTSFIYLKLAKKYGKVTICHSHNTTNGYGIKGKIKNLFQLPTRFVTDYFIGCSKQANEWMFGKKIANSKNCFVINNGIEETRFVYNEKIRNKIRNEFNISKDEIVIGNVGRLVEQKNQKFLIQVFKKLSEEYNNIKLMIVGDGILYKQLIELTNELDLSNKVIFTKSRNDVNEILQAFDLFVLPSKNEGLGIVVVEAQASGLYSIVSDNVPNEANVTDLFIKCNSYLIDDWVNMISNAITNYKLHNYRKDRSSDIIKNNYSIMQISKLLCSFYYNIKE